MKYLVLLFFYTFNLMAQNSISLISQNSNEIWEGDQIKAILKLPENLDIGPTFDLKEGVYLVDIIKKEESDYIVNVIITDRDKISDALLEYDERKYPINLSGFNFKKGRIKQGSYIFGQELYGNNKLLFLGLFIILVCSIAGILYYIKNKEKIKLERKIKIKNKEYLEMINQIKDKDSFNLFYYRRFELKDFYNEKKEFIENFLNNSEKITFKDTLTDDDYQLLMSIKKDLLKRLEQ